jgi:hypothetical protein
MIVSIKPSPREYKRFRITMDNGKVYDFGLKGGSTYIDHQDKAKRDAYRKRHYANATEKKLIDNLVPSASLFAYYILWGDSTDINTNIKKLNSMWKSKKT